MLIEVRIRLQNCQSASLGTVAAVASRSSSAMRFIASAFNAAAAPAIEAYPLRSTCGTRRSRAEDQLVPMADRSRTLGRLSRCALRHRACPTTRSFL